MTATQARQQGYLVIADILQLYLVATHAELEHAHGIVDELTHLVIARLGEPCASSRSKATPSASTRRPPPSDAGRLLDMIEGCYVAFQRQVDEMRRATTCTCSACALIGALDLKFVAHLGSFVLQQSPTGPKPIGPDVILVHRLLKNGVSAGIR